LTERVPDDSTIRKLVRWLGPEVIEEITRAVIAKATGERRFVARAARIDSTVIEPTFGIRLIWGWLPTRPQRLRARPSPSPSSRVQTRRGCQTARDRCSDGCDD
jgi:hypothetical protein